MLRRGTAALLLFVASLGAAAPAHCADERPGLDLSSLGDSAIDQRTDFIVRRLDREKHAGQMYQYGWEAFYLASMAYNIKTAATTDDRKEKVTNIIEGVESMGSVAWSYYNPHPARLGAKPIRAMPASTREEKVARLKAAEDLLREDADAADERYQMLPHAINVATNVAAGALIWALADRRHALQSSLPGLLIGEAEIWSAPSRASGDLAEYLARFGMSWVSQLDWELVATPGGAGVKVRF